LLQVVGLETLYAVLSEEHLGLQMSVQEAWRVVSSERAKRKALELELEAEKTASRDNPINLALAHRIEELQLSEEQLKQENTELKEELELLEFRMLEMDSSTKVNLHDLLIYFLLSWYSGVSSRPDVTKEPI
jgi:hypothetical protein